MLVYQRVCQDCQSTLSSWQLGDRNFAMAGPLLALAAKFLANLCILKQHFSCWRNMCLQVFVQGIIEDHIWSDIRPTSTFHRFLEGYQLYRVACRMSVNRWESETWSRNELQKAKRQEVQDSNPASGTTGSWGDCNAKQEIRHATVAANSCLQTCNSCWHE
jgi:hypothetical protein